MLNRIRLIPCEIMLEAAGMTNGDQTQIFFLTLFGGRNARNKRLKSRIQSLP